MKTKLSWSVVWREAGTLVAAHRNRLLLGLGLLVIGRAASLVLPGSAGWLIDHVVHDQRADLLWPLALAVLVATMIQAATSFGLSQLLGIAGQQAINDLRQRVHDHVLRLPVARFDATQSGTLISRIMSDAEGIRNLVGTGIVQLIGGLITGVAVLVWLFILNWQLTAAIAVLLAIFGVIMASSFKRLRPLFKERQKVQGEISGSLGQVLGGIRIVKVFTAEERLSQRFAADTGRLFTMIRATMTGFSIVTALTILVMGIAGCLFILIGGPAMASGAMTVGNAFQYVFLVGLLAGPIGQIASISTQLTEAFGGLDRIRELTAQPPETQGATVCPRLTGRVEFRDLTFGYDPQRPVLTDINLIAQPGQTIALVGPSGAGKTTLISLLLCSCVRSVEPFLLMGWISRICSSPAIGGKSAWCCKTTGCSMARCRKTCALPALMRATSTSPMPVNSLPQTRSYVGSRTATTRSSANAASSSAAVSASASLSPAPCSLIHASSSWMKPPAASTRKAKPRSRRHSRRYVPDARPSSSPTVCPRSAQRIRSWSSTVAASPSAARMTSCSKSTALTAVCMIANTPRPPNSTSIPVKSHAHDSSRVDHCRVRSFWRRRHPS